MHYPTNPVGPAFVECGNCVGDAVDVSLDQRANVLAKKVPLMFDYHRACKNALILTNLFGDSTPFAHLTQFEKMLVFD